MDVCELKDELVKGDWWIKDEKMNQRMILDKRMGDYDHVIDGEEVDLGGEDSPEHTTATTTAGRTSSAFIQSWKLYNNMCLNIKFSFFHII